MNTQELSQEEIRTIGLEVLARELGPTRLIRFLQMYEQGNDHYNEDRERIIPQQTAAQITEKIRRSRGE